jgi:outer membrane protein OmpA-like peptidoglycan-associated protein
MRHLKLLALSSVAIMALSSGSAFANDNGFTAHHSVAAEPYAEKADNLKAEQKIELHEYLNYEQREPCQNYQMAPQPFVEDGCNLKAKEKKAMAKTKTVTETVSTELRPVIRDYTVYFDFDDSGIRASDKQTLMNVASEIKTYAPYEVTIQGHADRSGPDDYNLALSQRRALSVSESLHSLGVPNRVLDQEAFGESQPAITTPDGVKLEENRRVEIQFRK